MKTTLNLLLLSLVLGIACPPEDARADTSLTADWIWLPQQEAQPYNQTIIARKSFRLDRPRAATLRITADTFYRLFINGVWVNDGPCRSYPEHFQYDVMDVGPYLRPGENEIRVIARYYGVGDFHHVPQRPGLLAQLDLAQADGATKTIRTDTSWQVAPAHAWVANTPKVSVQMEPAEYYDARLEDESTFTPAALVCRTEEGPWQDLNPRDVALMTRQPVALRSFVTARRVRHEALDFCLPAARLVHPGLIEANHATSLNCGMATVLVLDQPAAVDLRLDGWNLSIDGQPRPNGRHELAAGRHLLLALARELTSHNKEKSLRFVNPPPLRLENPLDVKQSNAWVFLRFPEFTFATNDLVWISYMADHPGHEPFRRKMAGFHELANRLLVEVKDEAAFKAQLGARAEQLPAQRMFVLDSVPETWEREVLGDAHARVRNPGALMHDTPDATVIEPGGEGDVELLYDLGEQNCGYYQFELEAEAGVTVDIVGVEYIAPDGRVQWSRGNRNGLRYITREGVNRFTSLKRRSGRYLFVTLRHFTQPVRIRHLNLIESTYPVDAAGSFRCSDARLDQIWEISARTLKLCMEDTYTDCPLYEQTHWVGDARNESLFGYTVFGATDLGRRCARQTAQSLGRFPIAGCQVPSGWDCLLPAWSFLWGISTWDHYWFTGDRQFLRELHPAVIQNLRGAESFLDERGLFSGPFWNMFDWTPIDQDHPAVLHNSMFFVGAIDAALKSEQALGCQEHEAWLRGLRERLVRGVNQLWNAEKQSYPDAIRRDGSISPSTSQHTSFLSVLYDLIDPANLPAAKRNILDPAEGVVKVGSPFAALYQCEALEKLGLDEEIVKLTYQNYLPMLEADATTVWESFPSGTTGGNQWPTRSHCHAWSSAPVYFLNRIVLGLKSTAPGWAAATLSPHPGDLAWARGTTVTPQGPVAVAWTWSDGALDITCRAPEAVRVTFATNPSLTGKTVRLNGRRVQ